MPYVPGKQTTTMSEVFEGSCAVCGNAARTRCSRCKAVFYCGRKHQRSDWPRHKSACGVYEIHDNEYLGRHILASRDIATEEVIFSEVPLVWGPLPHTNERICVGCGNKNALYKCPDCGWPACSSTCKGLAGVVHVTECSILKKAQLSPRCGYLLILRTLLLRERDPMSWRLINKLQSHEAKRGPDTEVYEEVETIIRYFNPILCGDSETRKILPNVCGLIDVNALETNPPEGCSAIYETSCLLEHRCIANTRHTFTLDSDGRPRISVVAVKPIKKGEHISTTYTHVLWSTRLRQEHLLMTKYFTCHCERCADPTELGSNLGTLKCICKNGFVTSSDPLEPDADWACDACPGVLSSAEVAQLTNRLAEEVEAAMTVPVKDIMVDLLRRLTVLLHPCHQYCITIGHSLIQLLSKDDPQKVELCQRMLDTIAIVDPHKTRLTLYHAIALRELSMCPHQDKNDLLIRAMEVLQYEPVNSPGEILANIIFSEA
ncbi:PREDICTED: protein msta, isoform B-like [Ceratosolen solmsi marchali]|uniref:Protein msta, isoform B-like n=1 Tax=Ceratosolen solmsi marchali TaxID=326594 RepID=A0AAJ6VLS4_9HYME|nr:PREDICTED: protein msta, isoform B-like [Ceratosolen solmsi marchali]